MKHYHIVVFGRCVDTFDKVACARFVGISFGG
jgi:hypothetical protein